MMEKDQVKIRPGQPWNHEAGECRCLRCGARWKARVINPVQCPRCKSLNWNRERGRC